MTDRIKSLTVVIEDNYRDDDCQELINAISKLRGVAAVSMTVDDMNHYRAKMQVKNEIREALTKFWASI